MKEDNFLHLLDGLFLSNYEAYTKLKRNMIGESNRELYRLYNDVLDLFYDGMDTVLEIIDICGGSING